jgi:hypothetical protein
MNPPAAPLNCRRLPLPPLLSPTSRPHDPRRTVREEGALVDGDDVMAVEHREERHERRRGDAVHEDAVVRRELLRARVALVARELDDEDAATRVPLAAAAAQQLRRLAAVHRPADELNARREVHGGR